MRIALAFAAIVGFAGLSSAAPTRAELRASQSLPDEHASPIACRPKGANCKVMNGKNPEGDNNLCCSSHCNWDNSAQNFICD